MALVEDNIKSPNEYAHLPPDPVDSEKSEGEEIISQNLPLLIKVV